MTLFCYYKFLLCASKTQEQLNPNKIHKKKIWGYIFKKKKRSFVSRFEQKHQQSMSAEKIFKNLFIKTTKL